MTILADPMERALDLARQAGEAGEVPVGAVIVDPDTGAIVADGYNRPIAGHDPTAHAEIVALRRAAEMVGNYRLTGMELFVTLEPCTMCAGAISLARIGRVIFGACDPKGGAVIHGARFFEQPTCHWRPEVAQDEEAGERASALMKDFFKARRA